MLRILSWSSGLGCDKVHSPEYGFLPPESQSSPVNALQLPGCLKRKRSPSFTVQTKESALPVDQADNLPLPGTVDTSLQVTFATSVPCENQTAPTDPIQALGFDASHTMENVTMDDATNRESREATRRPEIKPEARLQKMRQTISSQLSLEILLKHKELRLIDQELAKCQVALEQLRRCAEIPYPATQPASEDVSNGRGPALRRANNRHPATSPAPWGVTDGPYTRHYAKWLLSDCRFDGGELEPAQPLSATQAPMSARSTRGSVIDFAQIAGTSSRSQRGNQHKSLPAGYTQPKEKPTGPMIVKRKSDNKMVKLVCPDCGRHDFGSAQGFINHCRIGHQRSFASHDAAAEACGEAIDSESKPIVKAPEPIVTPAASSSGHNVHPLVRSARLLTDDASQSSVINTFVPGMAQRANTKVSTEISSGFEASTQTPHLSALVKQKGIGLDLQSLVNEAKKKVTLSELDIEDDAMEVDLPVSVEQGGGRHPQVAGSKQPHKSAASPAPASILNTRIRTEHNSQPGLLVAGSVSVLPSPTNESTQAPSLIDDDEDMDPQSPSSSDEIEEGDVHFHVRDDEHAEETSDIRGSELQSPPGTCAPSPTPRPQSRNSALRSDVNAEFNRSVLDGNSPGRDRKRRRLGNA